MLALTRLRTLPPRTVRLRLTLLYGVLFLVSGAVLLSITYLLFRRAIGVSVLTENGNPPRTASGTVNELLSKERILRGVPPVAQSLRAQAAQQRAHELHQLLTQSGIALAIMAVVSIALGWLVAGRALRPLRTITATTRRISERNLDERLALTGPRDELRDLADTVDDLLARLEASFGAHKRFVANAAHELRTPLTLLRALLEETLSDPGATMESLRATCRRLLTVGEEQERLLEALLTLASSERGLDHREPLDLGAIADRLLTPASDRLGVRIEADLSPAPTTGDPALAERLMANLIDNAVHHNTPGGWVRVSTAARPGAAVVSVANSGPPIPAEQIERLFEPFQRLPPDRTGRHNGHHGLGLSIVRAIATSHGATLSAHPGPEGGLAVEVAFPAAAQA